jgi:cytidylate kinase
LPFITTGLMYRAVARRALDHGVDVDDITALAGVARSLAFSLQSRGSPPGLRIDGKAAERTLESPEVEAVVSAVARHPEVRSILRAEQRRLGAAGSVMEGRDIGTVVFPDADLKVFLQADPSERVARRRHQRGDAPPHVAESLTRRDSLDARTNPLRPAPDAHAVDTTGRPPDQVLEEVLALARKALGR